MLVGAAVLLAAATLAAGNTVLDLGSAAGHATWSLANGNGSVTLAARVPGGVYSDLQRGGVLADVLLGDNDVLSRWVARDTWTYTARFYVTVQQLSARAAQLVLHGLDTAAYLQLNGHPLGRTDNMFVRYTYCVKEHLQVGVNVLTLEFESPMATAQVRSDRYFVAPECVPEVYHGECHANQIRKMQASFGWDWGPAFPSVGVWKAAQIEFIDSAVIRSVTTHISKKQTDWEVKLTAHLETGAAASTALEGYLEVQLQVDSRATKTVGEQVLVRTTAYGTAEVDLTLVVSENEVSVWWPNGFGEQPLYTLHLMFSGAGTDVARKDVQIGFRTVEVVEEEPSEQLGNSTGAAGLTFYFKVNGYPIFMKGSNWIPGHILPELGADKAMIDETLGAAQEAHMAMLRVWGGGVYESDYFYSRCDRLGILVWQDFMFACSMYPAGGDFLRSVTMEVKQNVVRLQHHTSIAVWAGNNENEAALRGNWYSTEQNFTRYKQEYIKLYVDTIKPIVEALDPSRRYLVSSPSNGRESDKEGYIAEDPYSSHYGDTHYYNYLADGWSMNIYPYTRFASEYGFQSFPSLATMRTATNNSDDFQLTSEFSKHRQHSPGGNEFVKSLIDKHLFLDETDPQYFSKFVFYSQISQAMTMKAESEFYRQSQADWYTMGALYWQLNDVWQAPSWAGIEFGGRWKILHYFAKNFFAPVLISPRHLASGDIQVYLINDKLVPIPEAQILVETFRYDSLTPLQTKSYNTSITALTVEKQPIFISALDIKHNTSIFFRFSLKSGKMLLSPLNYVFPEPLKTVTGLKVPNLQIAVRAHARTRGAGRHFTVRVKSDTVVLFLWLDAPGVAGRFVDNGVIVTEPITRLEFVARGDLKAERLHAAITYQYYVHPAH